MMNAWSQVKPSRLQSWRNQAVRSRLSVEALRLYDGLGVLVPARVDETSGYRYHDDAVSDRCRRWRGEKARCSPSTGVR